MTMTIDKLKLILLSGVGAVAVFFKAYSTMIAAVALSVTLDVVTGLIKAKVAGTVSSRAMRKGLLKKLGLFLALAFGVFLDWFIPAGLSPVGITFPVDKAFALIICAYIVVNEGISICENLYAIEPRALPSFVSKWLGFARDSLNDNKNKDSKKDGDNDE